MGHPAVAEAAVVAVPHPQLARAAARGGGAARRPDGDAPAELRSLLAGPFPGAGGCPTTWSSCRPSRAPPPASSSSPRSATRFAATTAGAERPGDEPAARPLGPAGHRPPRRLGATRRRTRCPPSSWPSQQGADAFELDVRLTRDGARGGDPRRHARPHHRPHRPGPRPDAGRAPRWPTRATGSRRTAGAPSRSAAQGVRIPTLAEVLWAFPAMPVMIEVKEPEVQEAVRRVLVEEGRGRALRGGVGARRGARAVPRGAVRVRRRRRPRSSALYRAALLRRPLPECRATGCCRCRVRHRGLPVPTRRVRARRRGGSAVRCTCGP